MDDGRELLRGQLAAQARWCATLGSPLYAHLLAAMEADVAAGGPAWTALEPFAHDPVASVPPLRLLGAVHRLVLEGRAPALAAFYPSVGGTRPVAAAWPVFRDALVEHATALRTMARAGVQTNEVGRAAALVGGFLTVAREAGLPLRCLETGASAGLNLRWDRFRYETAAGAWGDAASPLVLRDAWLVPPPLDVAARVAERRGCDVAPLDPTTPAGRTTLLAYVWPDQTARFALLRAALDVAARVPAVVDHAGMAAWLHAQLATPRTGAATVVYHSIMLAYVPDAEREDALATIADAGTRATPDAPLAWLRMEPGGEQAEVRLTTWPGGTERLLASTSFHGRDVRWLAG